jgi:hypothetical protein
MECHVRAVESTLRAVDAATEAPVPGRALPTAWGHGKTHRQLEESRTLWINIWVTRAAYVSPPRSCHVRTSHQSTRKQAPRWCARAVPPQTPQGYPGERPLRRRRPGQPLPRCYCHWPAPRTRLTVQASGPRWSSRGHGTRTWASSSGPGPPAHVQATQQQKQQKQQQRW